MAIIFLSLTRIVPMATEVVSKVVEIKIEGKKKIAYP
jgi:hypothetical protein